MATKPGPGRQQIPVFPQTFADESDRSRLTPAAIKAMKRIADHWHLKGAESAALLGVSASTWDRIVAGRRNKSALPGPTHSRFRHRRRVQRIESAFRGRDGRPMDPPPQQGAALRKSHADRCHDRRWNTDDVGRASPRRRVARRTLGPWTLPRTSRGSRRIARFALWRRHAYAIRCF